MLRSNIDVVKYIETRSDERDFNNRRVNDKKKKKIKK